ncbi:MAG: conjugal transfer protein TrbD [Burkholderiales bacterium]|nr:conjugal transfer protein TrbD [Burkholderiales bacterium]
MTASSQLRRTIVHRALHRPNLLMGGERELVMFSLLISGGLIVSALNLPALVFGTVFWGLTIGILRKMGKADPYLSTVYRRQLRYAPYYPPRSTPFRTL